MNKKRTSRIGLIKYALLLPVTGLLILSANAGTVVKMAGETWQEINRVLPQQDEQNVTIISGTVTDEHGNPLPGATVIIKETSVGSVSDVNCRSVNPAYWPSLMWVEKRYIDLSTSKANPFASRWRKTSPNWIKWL